jgi:serine/threonine protein kinase
MSERFGSWELEKLVAVGGLGEIWRASRGEEVAALKRLHTHLARNAEARAQFKLEQKLATELPRHPNVIHADDAGSVGDRPYVALDLARGEDLRRTVAAGEPMLPARVRAIVAAASDGTSHLHRHGYVHGDLCPGNLMVNRADHVTVIDLGIARPIGGAGVVRGTHAYMAPEQVRGEAWTAATDVFALGVVLWELAAGARLFHRGPPWLTMAAVVEADAPALPDPALDAIARAALAKDPADRIATAAALAARLRG